MSIEGIEFSNITISAQTGFECLHAQGIRISNASQAKKDISPIPS